MKTSLLSKLTILVIATITLISCNDKKNQFVIDGSVANADTTMLYLEKRTLTETTVIDSIKLDKEGNFKFSKARLDYPEFYLLRLAGQTINLAVDSTETITVKAQKDAFATEYTIEGSNASAKIKDVVLDQNKLSKSFSDLSKKYENKEISQDQYTTLVVEAVNEYKEKARDLIYSDYTSPAAYFALFQKVDNYLIFDPYDKKDIAVFQAIATIWDSQYPNSPRTANLKSFTLAALSELRKANNQTAAFDKIANTQKTESSAYYDINLPDMHNKNISLSSLKGKVVILDFTAYQTDFSPAHNILINKAYSKYKGSVEVYQVSFDSDVHVWQNSAVNLPWICVRDQKSLASDLLAKYNIQGLPSVFLVNKQGEIVKRILSTDDLSVEVQKLL
ncbi:AhpC/TSA family protein [Dysgonomonas sp. Marseille-P4677]|uniref:TlpA disulfide reductase family protein n=1 Tax=Dysgonomonas sp. Marseille-P4677 TaxID=2364790 RepID=UPI001913A9A7|nr:TlpA disulfide reductase family protein [Dysgonomonas sp. Marseille-P4677]MBK5722670.1 AhpC/TSA family protein [Dysgonomonas sp. Marseille-P4677]